MKKNVPVSMVVYEMLVELSKKKRVKPEVWVEEVVKEFYIGN